MLRSIIRQYTTINTKKLTLNTKRSNYLANINCYPSISFLKPFYTVNNALKILSNTESNTTSSINSNINVVGIISSIRSSGKNLFFIDIINSLTTHDRNNKIQLIFNSKNITTSNEHISNFLSILSPGDSIFTSGLIKNSNSINCNSLPIILSIQNNIIPPKLIDKTKINSNKILNYKINNNDIIIQRSNLLKSIRKYLYLNDFIEVETPILSNVASGAIANSFKINNNNNSKDIPLHLRIAPELNLKKLIISGLPKIFEIGKSFRNEGIDYSHNPEFTTLEFYSTFKNLNQLILDCQDFWKFIILDLNLLNKKHPVAIELFNNNWSFKKLKFLPTLSNILNHDLSTLPLTIDNFNNIELINKILSFLPNNDINLIFPISNPINLSQLLNKLSSHYLESLTINSNLPTIITEHPSILSPLAKKSGNNNIISQRFELFINGVEYMNAYEEENDPNIQLQNFISQPTENKPDNAFIDALNWGLPPTGGVGLGIDRLLMLFAQKDRIDDVLPLGDLNHLN